MPYLPSSTAEEIELATPELVPAEDQDQHPPLPPLPRADGGRRAWTYLAGAFLVEAMVRPLTLSFHLLAWDAHGSRMGMYRSGACQRATVSSKVGCLPPHGSSTQRR